MKAIQDFPAAQRAGDNWAATGLGFALALVLGIASGKLSGFLLTYFFTHNTIAALDGTVLFTNLWLAFIIASMLVNVLIAGFAVGRCARSSPYRCAVLAVAPALLTLLLINVRHTPGGFGGLNFSLTFLSIAFSLAGAAGGVFLAQSFRRNRGVRIE